MPDSKPQATRPARDLAWCLTSQPLLANSDWSIFSESHAAHPAPPPAPHRFRLGRHFELLLQAWMTAGEDDIELLAANLPVRDGKRTVGEFDFIVRYRGEIEHWEAAIKFYLGTGDQQQRHQFFGPNTADRLDIKLNRLTSHQLQLADHPAAQAVLAERGLPVARSRCLMKGRLFHPFDTAPAAPAGINPHHESGWWLSHEDFLARFEDSGSRFVFLPKSLWLSPLTAEESRDGLSFWEMGEMLASADTEQATHIAIVDDAGEISRGFVVTDAWLTRVKEMPVPAGAESPHGQKS